MEQKSNPRIIGGICEFCGINASRCQHYLGLVDYQGIFLPDKKPSDCKKRIPRQEVLGELPQEVLGELPRDIYNNIKEFKHFPDHKKSMVDIVLIKFNLPNAEKKAIDCVNNNTSWPHKLTVYDNYKTRHPLSDLWNRMIKKSDCKFICLLNNDAFVTKGWLTEMMKPFSDPKVAAVGCSGDHVGGVQKTICTEDIAKDFKNKYKELDLLSGYCFIVRKNLPFKFPSEIPFYGGEHAWCVQARRAGYKLIWSQGSFVYHLGEASAKKEKTVKSLRKTGQENYVNWLAKTTPVLFTTYNRLEYTKKALRKLMDSITGRIYIFDNASSDGTKKYLKSMKKNDRIVIYFSDKNIGVSGAMNWFFTQTEGEEFVAKVDNDTVVKKDWLLNMLMMMTWRNIDIGQAKHSILNNTYDTFEEWCDNLKQDEKLDKIFYSPFVGGSGLVIRRSKIIEPLAETDWILGGWTHWQDSHPELRKAFFSNVYVELLDMAGDNDPIHKDYKGYYIEVGRTMNRTKNVLKTLAEIINRFGSRFAYTRFGDGELMMLNGKFKGHQFTQYNSPDFMKELVESFKIDNKDYLIGNMAGVPMEIKAEPGFFSPFPNDDELKKITQRYYFDKVFYNPFVFHYLYANEVFTWDLVKEIFKKYSVGFVGGEHLKGIKKKFNIKDFIITPSEQSYDCIDEWYPKVEVIAERNDIILLSLSMTSNVVQKRLWNSKIKVGTIDFGSVANAMVNKNLANHTWIKKANKIKEHANTKI